MELPEGWVWEPLGNLVDNPKQDLVDGPFGSNLKADEYIEDGVPVFKIQNIKAGRFIDKKISFISEIKAQSLIRHSFKSGDLIITKLGEPLGLCCKVPDNYPFGIIVADLMRLRPSKLKVVDQYLVYVINSEIVQSQFKLITKGTTRARVNLTIVRDIKIPIPKLEIQKKILEKIEELFSELDKGIENLKTAQKQLKVYRQAVLKWAFEGRLTNENVKDGELPEGWKWVTFSDVCYKIGDIDHKMPKTTPTGYPYLSTKDFSDDLKISFDHAKFISKEDYLALSRKIKPEYGDIIFPRYGTIGKNILIDFKKDFLVSYSCAIIKPNTNIVIAKYLYLYSLSPHTTNEIRNYVVETTQANIGIASIKKFRLSLPSLNEQQNVVQSLESRLSVCDKIEESITNSLRQAEALRQTILKKAFEGKLVKTIKQPLEAKIVSIENNDNWQRKVLAGHIIYAFQKGGYVGRTKLQKILYLCEQHAQLDFDTRYLKEAAGPLDSKFLYAFLNEAKQKNWIEETQVGNGGYKYEPSTSISELTTDYPKYFRSNSDKIGFVIKLLKDTDTDTAELIATIYAIWNNYIIEQKSLSTDLLPQEVYSWHEDKVKFKKPMILSTWQWMKDEKLIPTGFGEIITKSN
ncbi:restriction endonuclease subunit S [Mucilaginibacter sp. CAU 1740]